MRIYFDTEFCNLWDPTPISFGFAAENGDDLYIEVVHNEARRGEFVNKVIVPLLSGGEPLTPWDASQAIHDWLERPQMTGGELVCDFIGDYWILNQLMRHKLPVTPRCARHANTEPIFKAHPELRQHHALDDARALRFLNPPLQVE